MVNDESEKRIAPLTLVSLKTDYPYILDTLLSSYELVNRDEYREQDNGYADDSLFGALGLVPQDDEVKPVVEKKNIIFAVDDYSENKKSQGALDEMSSDFDFSVIIPRSQKAKDIQKRRVKEKAEVFTPTWVCNLQNNLIDDESVGKGAFNVISESKKTWTPSEDKVFDDSVKAVDYIHSNRLEISCGEAPYLVSTYDTVSGEYIDVKDSENRFQRIGLLDRKLRVVTEFAGSHETNGDIELWKSLAYGAFSSIYGYEWQGDNLLLARLNLLNTYRDYYYDAWNEEPDVKDLYQIAVIISMNIIQMDGLRAVKPLSAGEDRGLSRKEILPDKKTGYYDGVLPVISFNHDTYPYDVAFNDNGESINSIEWLTFEELMKDYLLSKVQKKKK